jgi:hypothetical protein
MMRDNAAVWLSTGYSCVGPVAAGFKFSLLRLAPLTHCCCCVVCFVQRHAKKHNVVAKKK